MSVSLLGACGHGSVVCVSISDGAVYPCVSVFSRVCVVYAHPWQVVRWQLSVQLCCPGAARGDLGPWAGSCWSQSDQPSLA